MSMPTGYDCDMEPIHVKFVTQGNAGDSFANYSIGFVDGMARCVILHIAVILLHDEVPS